MKNQAPFLDVSSFIAEGESSDLMNQELSSQPTSPFVSLYESDEAGGLSDPVTEEYVVFLNELYDEEFTEALVGLANEANYIFKERFLQEHEEPSYGYPSERLLQQHFAPLITEAENMLDFLTNEFSQRDPYTLSEEEIDQLIDSYSSSLELSPRSEEFIGKIKKGVKKVAKKVSSAAKKGIKAVATGGISLILPKLKGLIKPLLNRVIKFAIGKLPANLQPIAKKLADKIPLLKEMEEASSGSLEPTLVSEIEFIQNEFNYQIANLIFAKSEVEQDLELAMFQSEAKTSDYFPIDELDNARERFVENLLSMREGENPTPYIENFIPAILPALRMGIKIIGRKRVVNFLAKLLGKLIQRFVGPQHTPALSRAIVDAGLRLIQLEAKSESDSSAAASAVASTVEETIRRVSDAPDYILDDQELLEGFALEAFEQAAANNLPPILSEEVYKKRPSLGVARKHNGVWAMMPSGARKRYKKFSRKIPVKFSPIKTANIESFKGVSIEELLEEVYDIAPGENVEGFIHLYEAIPGTTLSDIVQNEDNINRVEGFNFYEQLHPLTREAASVLMGEPELGRDTAINNNTGDPYQTQPGQRYYYLELPGKRPLTNPLAKGKSKGRRSSQLRIVFDFPNNQIRVIQFLSEVRAQELAVKLRQNAHSGALVTRLSGLFDRGLKSALNGAQGRVKIIHEAITPDQWTNAFKRLPSILPQILHKKLVEWMVKGLSTFFKKNSEAFIKATDDAADGVTIKLTLVNPPSFPQLRQAFKGKIPSLASLKMIDGLPDIKIVITPGFSNE